MAYSDTRKSVHLNSSKMKRKQATEWKFRELLTGNRRPCTRFRGRQLQDLATLLCGMGLEHYEVELFIKRNVTLDRLLKLSEEDLICIGLTNPDKRKYVVEGITILRAEKATSRMKRRILAELQMKQELLRILSSSNIHFKVLCKALPYIQTRFREDVENQYFNGTRSVHHKLQEMTEKCLHQTNILCQQMEKLQWDVHQEMKKRRPPQDKFWKKIQKTHVVVFLSTAVLCFAVWKLPAKLSLK